MMGLPIDSTITLVPLNKSIKPFAIKTTKGVVFEKSELQLHYSQYSLGKLQSYVYKNATYPIYNGIQIKRIEWDPDTTGIYK